MLARYATRRKRRLVLRIRAIQPRSKRKMPDLDKAAFQSEVLRSLNALRRKAFRGSVAVYIRIETSEATPSHLQSIGKNILDLLGAPVHLGASTSRKSLLYADDSQVHGLSVSCSHGHTAPSISITAMPHRDIIDDLALAAHAQEQIARNHDEWQSNYRFDEEVKSLRSMLRDEPHLRERFGDEVYHDWVRMAKRGAQEQLLHRTGIRFPELSYLHGASPWFAGKLHVSWRDDMAQAFEKLFRTSPFRISLGELPHRRGQSKTFKQQVKRGFSQFRDQYAWILKPLQIPIALEVIVKPPRSAPAGTLHDLDNIVRDYLIPRVLEELEPPSSFVFGLRDTSKPEDIAAVPHGKLSAPVPPSSTRIGVIRYEGWRLPRRLGDPNEGFVCVNIVGDLTGYGDSLRFVDNAIAKWSKDEDR